MEGSRGKTLRLDADATIGGKLKPRKGLEGPRKGVVVGRLMGKEKASGEAIARAAAALCAGRLVAFPTETVYGLGADASNARAVAAVFAAKGRPRFNPLIVHVPDLAAALRLAEFSDSARQLAAAFWPGALTLVLPRRPDGGIAELTTAGLDTIAVRVPAHAVAVALLRAAGRPIAAPSANRSGHVSPTTAEHVEADLGNRVHILLDGGPTPLGIGINGGRCQRPWPSRAAARRHYPRGAGGRPGPARCRRRGGNEPPGLARHAAAPLCAGNARCGSRRARLSAGEALLAFGAQVPPHAGPVFNLSASGDLLEAAANLFAGLRRAG